MLYAPPRAPALRREARGTSEYTIDPSLNTFGGRANSLQGCERQGEDQIGAATLLSGCCWMRKNRKPPQSRPPLHGAHGVVSWY